MPVGRGDERDASGNEDAVHLLEALGRRDDVFEDAVAKDDVLRIVANRNALGGALQHLGGVVQVEGDVLKQLPKDLRSLEDRSLLEFKAEQAKQIFWRFGERQGHLVQTEGGKWVWKLNDGKEREFVESWQLRAFLWELDDAEYERRDDTAGASTMGFQGYVEFWSGQEKLGAIGWEKPKSADSATVLMWLMPGNGTPPMTVQTKSEIIKKTEQKLTELAQSQPQ